MVECTLSITHCLRLNLKLHTIDLVRTCRISSFCTVAWQLASFQLTRRIARSLGDSWASCFYLDHKMTANYVRGSARLTSMSKFWIYFDVVNATGQCCSQRWTSVLWSIHKTAHRRLKIIKILTWARHIIPVYYSMNEFKGLKEIIFNFGNKHASFQILLEGYNIRNITSIC